MFFGYAVPPDSKEIELGSNDQEEASPSAGKNARVVLAPRSHIEMHPFSYFWWCGYLSEVPGCYLLRQMSSQ